METLGEKSQRIFTTILRIRYKTSRTMEVHITISFILKWANTLAVKESDYFVRRSTSFKCGWLGHKPRVLSVQLEWSNHIMQSVYYINLGWHCNRLFFFFQTKLKNEVTITIGRKTMIHDRLLWYLCETVNIIMSDIAIIYLPFESKQLRCWVAPCFCQLEMKNIQNMLHTVLLNVVCWTF